jgi:hypothetical protein
MRLIQIMLITWISAADYNFWPRVGFVGRHSGEIPIYHWKVRRTLSSYDKTLTWKSKAARLQRNSQLGSNELGQPIVLSMGGASSSVSQRRWRFSKQFNWPSHGPTQTVQSHLFLVVGNSLCCRKPRKIPCRNVMKYPSVNMVKDGVDQAGMKCRGRTNQENVIMTGSTKLDGHVANWHVNDDWSTGHFAPMVLRCWSGLPTVHPGRRTPGMSEIWVQPNQISSSLLASIQYFGRRSLNQVMSLTLTPSLSARFNGGIGMN